MIHGLQKTLTFLLLLLQLIAPLVHAHVHSAEPLQGLHVPGMELLVFKSDRLVMQSSTVKACAEGLLVKVSSGILAPRLEQLPQQHAEHFVNQDYEDFDTDCRLQGFLTHCNVLSGSQQPFYSSPTRAPPHQ